MENGSLFLNDGMAQSERYLHTPGMFAKQNLLYVQETGRLRSLKPHKCVRENLASYLFVAVLEGTGRLNIKGKEYQISKGDCALIDCMEHYEHISDEQNGWKLAWVHFNGHAAKGYYSLFKKCNKESNVFHTENIQCWDAMIGELLHELRKRTLYAELKCGEILSGMLNEVLSSVSDRNVLEYEQQKQTANELRERLNELYASADILEKVELLFGEKTDVLNENFQDHFGISIEEYVSNRRLNAAKELLRFSIQPVEVIAKESGIGSLIIMQQMFRDNEGVTVEEYRKKWAQWVR